jgi:hypothetical protein
MPHKKSGRHASAKRFEQNELLSPAAGHRRQAHDTEFDTLYHRRFLKNQQ